jgi:hypothetical protein
MLWKVPVPAKESGTLWLIAGKCGSRKRIAFLFLSVTIIKRAFIDCWKLQSFSAIYLTAKTEKAAIFKTNSFDKMAALVKVNLYYSITFD